MAFAALVAIVGLVFGMISIKLISIVENAQVVLGKGMQESRSLSRASLKRVKASKFMDFAISNQKLFFLRVGIAFFGRISSMIFFVEAMYPEKIVETAAFAMMKTVLISNRIRIITVRNGNYAIRKIRLKKTIPDDQGKVK